MNEESLKSDLATDIEKAKSLTLLGDRVVILLDFEEQETTTSSGIILPLTEIQETDGGKLKTRPALKRHLSQGTVLNISSLAVEKFKEEGMSLDVDTQVYVASTALNQSFHFYPNRTQLVTTFSGFICVPHNLIEAIV